MIKTYKFISILWLSTGLFGCVHSQVTVQPRPAEESQIISFQKDLKIFWGKAVGQPFEAQLKLWDLYVEAPHQDFYDSVVWEKKYNSDWSARKRRQLLVVFSKYEKLMPTMQANFTAFQRTIEAQLNKFEEMFPEPKLNVPVYAALSPNFNGRGATLSVPGKPDQTILAFSMDMISSRKDSMEILFPHELFHIYHFQVTGITQDGQMTDGKLTLPLWEEGLATYVSGQMSPGHSDGDLLMDPDLGSVPASRLAALAKKFLLQAEEKAFDSKKPEIYRSWFNVGKDKVASDLPNRCGYILGLYIVRTVVKTHSLSELTRWDPVEIHRQVKIALKEIAGG